MIINKKLLNVFVKDFNIPISVYEPEIFIEQIKILGYENEYIEFTEILKHFNSEEDFFVYRKKIQDDAINYIKELNSYTENITLQNYSFNFMDIKINKDIKFSFPFKTEKNLYTEKNIGKKFISIDMKNANFQVFQQTGVIYDITYKLFLSKFDIFDYFYKSKNIRQIIFGNLNPKRTNTIQKHIINALLSVIINDNKNINFDTIIINNDEIILSYDEFVNLSFLETFVLKEIKDIKNKLFYYKEYKDKKVLYTVPKTVYIQAYKKLHNIPITDNDLLFHYEGANVKFLENQF